MRYTRVPIGNIYYTEMTLYYNLCNTTPHRAHVTFLPMGYDGVYTFTHAPHTRIHTHTHIVCIRSIESIFIVIYLSSVHPPPKHI